MGLTPKTPIQTQGKDGQRRRRLFINLSIFIFLAVLVGILLTRTERSPEQSSRAETESTGLLSVSPLSRDTLKGPSANENAASEFSAALKRTKARLPSELQLDAAELTERVTSADVVARNRALERFKNQLMALEALDPELDSLALLLREIDPSADAFASLVAAAGAVPVPAVQKVFLNLLTERNADWKTFSAVVPVLGGVLYPQQETLDYLSKIAREAEGDFSSTAALALGGSAYTLSKTHPARSERLLENYISVLTDQRSGTEDIKLALAVLGNAGLAATAEPILNLTRHSRTDVRAEAVMALRFMGSPDAERRLLQILESDEHPDVRIRVTDALVHRPLNDNTLLVARRILADAKDEPLVIREKVLDLIMHFVFSEEQSRDIRNWLLGLAESESDMRLKKMLLDAAQKTIK